MGKRKTRTTFTAIGLVIGLLIGTVTAIGGLYPNPAHDFGPVAGAGPLYNALSGANTRPLLVVRVIFNDVTTPNAFTEPNTVQRVFGPNFPNMAAYYTANSFGKMTFTKAPETCGTANDGVVTVNVGSSATWLNLSESAQDRADLDAVNTLACVNFAVFDDNNDGQLTADEIAILEITALSRGCGASRPVAAGGQFNGKTIPSNINNRMSKADSNTNIITLAHEIGHQALSAYDLYGYGVGQLDLFGPTCGGADTTMFEYNAWQKTHLGWITPTVVTQDGYYDIHRADTTGNAYILYDPARGTNDYFIVENREPTASTYDQNATDRGLVIWRADDAVFGNGSLRAIEIIRPDGQTNPVCVNQVCYGGSNGDAWDPSDGATPQRSMSSPAWRDGTAALVTVRAIGDAGAVMRAFFDVRGPGILVDTYARMKQGPIFVPLGDTANVTFPVTNTGESTDTFAFTITVPAGFSASTETQSLVANGGGVGHVDVTPSLNVATGQYLMNATGRSINDPNVTSSSPVQIWVIKRQATVTYIGDLAADYHDAATLSAKLTDTETGDPIAGETVTFTLGSQQATAVTDQFGIANTSLVLTQTPGVATVKTDYAGNSVYFPSNDGDTFTITREETTTTYTGPTVILQGSSGVTLQARLLEDGTTAPAPSGQTLTLSLGAQSCNATADNTGLASCSFIYTGALGPQPLSATFAGDTYYEPSSDTSKTALVFAFPSSGAFLLGDDTVATAGPSTLVTWWDSSWSSLVSFSSGDSPAAFKGYASTVVTLPTTTPPASCSGTWSTASGSSAPPTSGVPSYMGVLVTPSVGKSGSTISGTYSGIVIVATDAGYAPSAGHSGTGHIVATFC